jgi:hypothetical protein
MPSSSRASAHRPVTSVRQSIIRATAVPARRQTRRGLQGTAAAATSGYGYSHATIECRLPSDPHSLFTVIDASCGSVGRRSSARCGGFGGCPGRCHGGNPCVERTLLPLCSTTAATGLFSRPESSDAFPPIPPTHTPCVRPNGSIHRGSSSWRGFEIRSSDGQGGTGPGIELRCCPAADPSYLSHPTTTDIVKKPACGSGGEQGCVWNGRECRSAVWNPPPLIRSIHLEHGTTHHQQAKTERCLLTVKLTCWYSSYRNVLRYRVVVLKFTHELTCTVLQTVIVGSGDLTWRNGVRIGRHFFRSSVGS